MTYTPNPPFPLWHCGQPGCPGTKESPCGAVDEDTARRVRDLNAVAAACKSAPVPEWADCEDVTAQLDEPKSWYVFQAPKIKTITINGYTMSWEDFVGEREMGLREALRSEMLTLVIEQNADLRDRLRILASKVCNGCGCAPVGGNGELCWDCDTMRLSCVIDGWSHWGEHYAACVSVGMRALCGRKLLEVC